MRSSQLVKIENKYPDQAIDDLDTEGISLTMLKFVHINKDFQKVPSGI